MNNHGHEGFLTKLDQQITKKECLIQLTLGTLQFYFCYGRGCMIVHFFRGDDVLFEQKLPYSLRKQIEFAKSDEEERQIFLKWFRKF